MMNVNLIKQVELLREKHPSLTLIKCESGFRLTGIVVLNAEYNGLPLYDEYNLEIFVPFGFPKAIPSVKELENKIPEDLSHFYADGGLCLGAISELADYLEENDSLVGFVNDIVMSYLYTASYFRRYGEVPYGERSHGVLGIEETYFERYHTQDRKILIQLLLCLMGEIPYRGHCQCPCEGGKKLRTCHGKYILKDLRSQHYEYYKNDAMLLLKFYVNEMKKGGKI